MYTGLIRIDVGYVNSIISQLLMLFRTKGCFPAANCAVPIREPLEVAGSRTGKIEKPKWTVRQTNTI